MKNGIVKPDHGAGRMVCPLVLAVILLGCVLPQAASAEPTISLTPSTTHPYFACPHGLCDAVNEPPAIKTSTGYALPDGTPLVGGGVNGGWAPSELQSAYKITLSGSKQTVALVDAYYDETAEADLAVYRKQYKLGECTKSNGCFKWLAENGEEVKAGEKEKTVNAGWGIETSLDLDMVSAACPECHIMLVEAKTEGMAALGASVNTAVEHGATVVSNSYGAPEDYEPWCGKTGCEQYNSDYNHPGVAIMASTGDYGYDNHEFGAGVTLPSFPATSPYVMAVGGTAVNIAKNPRGWAEKVWPEGGSGCSAFESKPAWQKDAGCSKRTDSDLAADASCETPVSIYSTPYFGGWTYECGTSASSPLVAGIEAHANDYTRDLGADPFYSGVKLFDVTLGSNGTCAVKYLCTAETGYDGPTGWGTPDGTPTATAGSPIAITTAATAIKTTEATLNGTVNPGGAETKYDFEYGLTTSYGSKTAVVEVGSKTGNLPESKIVTGLTSSTTYHYRIVATNSHGTTDGSDQAFSTTQGPPENTVLPVASPATPDQAVPESTTAGTWTNKPTGYAYQWERCNTKGSECKELAGATSSTYTPVAEDVEHALVVKVTAKNSAGEGKALSAATNAVKAIGEITEYGVGGAVGIGAGPDGNLWFTIDGPPGEIGKITTSGTVTEYPLQVKEDYLNAIVAGPDENLWFTVHRGFTGESAAEVGKITTSGTVTEYALPIGSEPMGITKGPDGDLWFTDRRTSKIGKITTSGTITEYALHVSREPYAIATGPDGNLWFTEPCGAEFGCTGYIGKITTSGTITEYTLPSGSGPVGIVAGPDGNLWFTEYSASKIGKITTSGTITEYALPKGNEPQGITAAPDGNLWFTEASVSEIGRITTSGTVTEYALPKGSDPQDITVGSDENVWFTNYFTSKVGKITP